MTFEKKVKTRRTPSSFSPSSLPPVVYSKSLLGLTVMKWYMTMEKNVTTDRQFTKVMRAREGKGRRKGRKGGWHESASKWKCLEDFAAT